MVAIEAEMEHPGDANKIIGLFEQNGVSESKTVENFWVDGNPDNYPEGEPILAEMTEPALKILEKDEDGFFLMVEDSQIDWKDHGNRIKGQLAESLSFDAALGEVLEWIEADPVRREETLPIVVADHDTGGFGV